MRLVVADLSVSDECSLQSQVLPQSSASHFNLTMTPTLQLIRRSQQGPRLHISPMLTFRYAPPLLIPCLLHLLQDFSFLDLYSELYYSNN